MRRYWSLLAVASLLTGMATLPANVAKASTSSCGPDGGRTMYVADFGDEAVSPVDLACGTTAPTISVGTSPTYVAIKATARTAYVLNFDSSNVTPIDTATNTGRPAITLVPSVFPQDMAISPDGATLYVTGDQDARGLIPIRTADRTVQPSIPVGGNPLGVAVTPNGSIAYVALSDRRGFAVRLVRLATGRLGPRIAMPSEVDRLAISPDASTLYGMSGSGIVVVSTATNTVKRVIRVIAGYIEIMPGGATAFVANSFTDTVTELALPSGAVRHTLHLNGGSFPDGLAANPDSKTVYVSLGGADTVLPVAVKSGQAGRSIRVGSEPFGLAVTPDQAPFARFPPTCTRRQNGCPGCVLVAGCTGTDTQLCVDVRRWNSWSYICGGDWPHLSTAG